MKHLLVVLCAMAGLAWSEEAAPPAPLAVLPHDWHGFKTGTWVETRSTLTGVPPAESGTTRMTLLPEKDGAPRILTRNSTRPAGKYDESPVVDSPLIASSREEAGEENIQIGDKTLRCHVWTSKFGKPDGSSGTKVWISKDCPVLGGLVRMDDWSDSKSFPSSSITKITELGRQVDVCGRKVACYVLQAVQTRDGEKDVTTFEELRSPEVPGAMVKRSITREWKDSTGEKRSSRSEEEVCAVHLEGAEWAPAEPPAKK